MSIKQCRVCGIDFDTKGACNARNCPDHRMTYAKSQALYQERLKHARLCWCGQYTTDKAEFCSAECQTDATRYRDHIARHKDNPLNLFTSDTAIAYEQFNNRVKTNYLQAG